MTDSNFKNNQDKNNDVCAKGDDAKTALLNLCRRHKENKNNDKIDFDTMHVTTRCTKCGRKIYVAVVQFGISHIGGITAACADCIKWDDTNPYCREYPDECAEINRRFKEMDSE